MFDIVDPFAYKEKLMMPKVRDLFYCVLTFTFKLVHSNSIFSVGLKCCR